MMDKRKVAEIILQAIDDYAPVQVDWNNKKWWIDAILAGLTEVEKGSENTDEKL